MLLRFDDELLALGKMLQNSEFEEELPQVSALWKKLGNFVIGSEFDKQGAIEESQRQRRAQYNTLIAEHEVEEEDEQLENVESRRIKEIEELLLEHGREIEEINHQRAQCLEELKLIHEQNSVLKLELREGKSVEKDLEEKVIQAVNLLIIFRKKRDKLQAELDSAVREINKRKVLNGVDLQGTTSTCFFGFFVSEVIEATQNFSESHKIGEGKYGSVYKGVLRCLKVAIRVLPSSGFQSDSEFNYEAEILARVRHPNLVTLIGSCWESKLLIYESIDNCSLEHYLSSPEKASSLPWQTRIRIATEICSALLFVHGNTGCNVHGNLKASNILLDSNLVAKISDFGIHSVISPSEDHPNLQSESPYLDPEFHLVGQLTTHSDVFSFGVIMLQLLTARPSATVVRDVKLALERGNIESLLDISAGNWPVEVIEQLSYLGLRCCDDDPLDRPHLESEIWTALNHISKLDNSSQSSSTNDTRNQRKVPSHFLCPIYQEVMTDPHIANDGFTYEGDAIKGWFNSGHMTSPMTNLKLQDCGLTPNYALYYAIQEWHHNT